MTYCKLNNTLYITLSTKKTVIIGPTDIDYAIIDLKLSKGASESDIIPHLAPADGKKYMLYLSSLGKPVIVEVTDFNTKVLTNTAYNYNTATFVAVFRDMESIQDTFPELFV